MPEPTDTAACPPPNPGVPEKYGAARPEPQPPGSVATESLRASVLWVALTAVTWAAVLIAATGPRWDTTLSACAVCFARGRWNRGR